MLMAISKLLQRNEPHCHSGTAVRAVVMKRSLFKGFQILWPPCPPLRHPKRQLASLVTTSHYEAINKGEQEVPDYFNFASDVLDEWTLVEKDGKRPPNPAFWWVNDHQEEVKWSFEELGFLAQKAANVLSGHCGLKRGDRILTVLPRIPEWWLLQVACMRAGIVFIPGTSQLTVKDIAYRLQASKAKCIVVSETLAPGVDSIASECKSLRTKLLVSDRGRDGWLNFKDLLQEAPADHKCVKTKSQEPMLIYFTSGSTGSPKMVEHTHCSYGIGFTASGRRWMDLSPSDIFWNTSDTGWVKSAWSSVFAPWILGSCVFVHHLPHFEPKVILDTLARYPITTFCTAPTAYRMLVQHDATSYKFMSLKHCVTGGEPLNPEVFERWKRQTGLDIYEGYGQTETVTICSNAKGMKIKPGSLGKASPPYDVQILDAEGKIQPPGEEGDIAIRIEPKRPFCLFSSYLDNPEKTAASERGGFYITGDRATKDEDGYIWFVGRLDDVINSAGYRIGPFEVESALIEHPAVVESAVVSSPDPVRGEVVKAFVILSPAFSSHDPEKLIKELQDHVKKVTAPYKYPRKAKNKEKMP
ncbi:acyl-coenzyme A synthetase ACSM5, mitochondrial isoform X2 [Pogona vitticeps]